MKATRKASLVITTNLGLMRAYRVMRNGRGRRPRLQLIDEFEPDGARQKLSDQLTDVPGRFPAGAGPGGVADRLSAGEQHNLQLEQTRRAVGALAERIDMLLGDEAVASCWLAASAPIHLQLLDKLAAAARAKVRHTLALDLVGIPRARLPDRLQDAGRPLPASI